MSYHGFLIHTASINIDLVRVESKLNTWAMSDRQIGRHGFALRDSSKGRHIFGLHENQQVDISNMTPFLGCLPLCQEYICSNTQHPVRNINI